MANRNFPSSGKMYSFHTMPVEIDLIVTIGATGAVSSFTGQGVAAVTRLSAGLYQVQLQDNYNSFLSMAASLTSPVSGSNVTAGSFSVGTTYQITALGTTNWNTAGLPTGLTAAVGMVFKAATVGAGTGTAKILGVSGITTVEKIGTGMLAPAPSTPFRGGYITLQTLGATDASTTTLIAKDPADGSNLHVLLILSNSSVQ